MSSEVPVIYSVFIKYSIVETKSSVLPNFPSGIDLSTDSLKVGGNS